MRRSLMWTPLAMSLSMPATGEVPVPEDFAYGVTVESEARGALWQLDLPDVVYRTVTRADLVDIRVFNRTGEVVPHALRLPGAEPEQAPSPAAIPFFPLYSRDEEDTAGQRLRIITNDRGTIVDTISMADQSDQPERITSYLLDTSALEHRPERLTLAWERPEKPGFAASVAVASSDDLSRWSTLVHEVTLADLQSGEALLAHNEIELPAHKARYLRITWPAALRETTLTGVLASFPPSGKPPQHRWLEVTGAPEKDDPLAFGFDAGGHWPADMARMNFVSSNLVVHASLMSRSTADDVWHRRHSGIFYTLEHEGAALKSEPASFKSTSDRYWRFKIADQERRMTGKAPTLLLGWLPHVLTFVAQGDPPYTVAFGNAVMTAAARPVDTLLQGIDEDQEKGLIAEAIASSAFTLGGEGKLQPPAAPFPWRTLVLWTVLLCGIVMLAWMVRRLLRQMGTPGDSPGTQD